MNQIALPLDWSAADQGAEFVMGAANRLAVRHLEHWGAWPVMATILTGPRKSGRSLLAGVFAARAGARVIDRAEDADEEAVFHAWNMAQETRRPLLLVADAPPPAWDVALPDLRSRLAASSVVAIDPPDQALIEALLAHLLARRGLDAPPVLTTWIARRIDRSYVALLRAVDLLDAASLSRRRRLSVPLARHVLGEAGLLDATQEQAA